MVAAESSSKRDLMPSAVIISLIDCAFSCRTWDGELSWCIWLAYEKQACGSLVLCGHLIELVAKRTYGRSVRQNDEIRNTGTGGNLVFVIYPSCMYRKK